MYRQYDWIIQSGSFRKQQDFYCFQETIGVFFVCLGRKEKGMEFVQSLFFIVLGFLFLVKGADFFVSNASGLAKKLGVSSLVIGLTVVAFGTSLPELAVSVTASLEGSNEIAVGNVVGSNIFNLLIVAGLSACIYPLVANKAILKRDWPLSIFASVLLMVFVMTGHTINRIEGVILLFIFALILWKQFQDGKKQEEVHETESRSYGQLLLWLGIGIVGIIVGGKLAVDGAVSFARIVGLSETLIGLTIVAIGTSLPELVTSVVAAKQKENEIALGNVIGSNLFNIFFILGLSSVVSPLSVQPTAVVDCLVLTLVSVVFLFVVKKMGLNKKSGIFMVITYILYMVYIVLR